MIGDFVAVSRNWLMNHCSSDGCENTRHSSWCSRFSNSLLVLFVVLSSKSATSASTSSSSTTTREKGSKTIPDRSYYIIGVSGGLQDGFPAHTKLDYYDPDDPALISKAILLGKGFVRGYKAFLDVMQEGWREYTYEPDQPVINSNVFASGCYEHANEYWVYLVDTRQVMSVLNNEPRFLSITPDTGRVSLNDTSDELVKEFLLRQIEKQPNKSNKLQVAIPLVTAVYFNPKSHVPSPPIRTLKEDDGTVTEVTNFPDSLALWANVSDEGRTAVLDEEAKCRRSAESATEEYTCNVPSEKAMESYKAYWDGIREAIRNAEQNRIDTTDLGPPFQCKRQERFGVDNVTARINAPLTAQDVVNDLRHLNDAHSGTAQTTWKIDFEEGEITIATSSLGESA